MLAYLFIYEQTRIHVRAPLSPFALITALRCNSASLIHLK